MYLILFKISLRLNKCHMNHFFKNYLFCLALNTTINIRTQAGIFSLTPTCHHRCTDSSFLTCTHTDTHTSTTNLLSCIDLACISVHFSAQQATNIKDHIFLSRGGRGENCSAWQQALASDPRQTQTRRKHVILRSQNFIYPSLLMRSYSQ